MLKSPHIILFIAGFFFLFNSCKKQNMCDCFKPRGETVIETRTVSNFNTLRAYDKIDVYFTQDSTITSPVIKVVTGKHLVSSVITEVSEGELKIQNTNRCNFVRGSHNDVTVYVTAPYVKYFIQDGVGNIFGTNTVIQDSVDCNIRNSGDIHLDVKTRSVVGHMHGIGDLYVSGTANSFFTNTVGQGFIYAQNFKASYGFIYYKSNGEARVNITGQLDGEIASTGNLYYTSNPPLVNVKITGSGKLIKF
jgi:hypothetical protein